MVDIYDTLWIQRNLVYDNSAGGIQGLHPFEQWKKGPVVLFRGFVGDEILPSYVGI